MHISPRTAPGSACASACGLVKVFPVVHEAVAAVQLRTPCEAGWDARHAGSDFARGR
ncbi:uncharacterized protein TRAVEDRAFT_29338 [Trametes versicolor FP-101664 SS1]|uniref:uncharacterized protein n=1 Tax=Trametes versicolor (strain FP-101664) TaxID=717944 RepID=UPI000462383B|nr:uncharacterized protein TRAVEDRAFT_29338 [Trametes versicolor FP-101664 SS1]EIW58943.1 hypothetical protein TRAVEDRAFT_29338 [Trametes versicolor FP-101664 SS1]